MGLISSVTILCDCILLLSLVLSLFAASIPANVPESDLPFEFNYDKGSEIIGENLLTQSVSSDGKTVLSTNSPQPIKKYNSLNNNDNNNNKNSVVQSTKTTHGKETQTNKENSSKKPKSDHVKTNKNKSNYYSTQISPMDIPMAQWNLIENMIRYIPGTMTNMRVVYI